MMLRVRDGGDGVIILQGHVTGPDVRGTLMVDLEPGEEYAGYTYEDLRELVGREVEVPKPGG